MRFSLMCWEELDGPLTILRTGGCLHFSVTSFLLISTECLLSDLLVETDFAVVSFLFVFLQIMSHHSYIWFGSAGEYIITCLQCLIFLQLLPCDSLYKNCKSSGVKIHTQSPSPLFKLNLTCIKSVKAELCQVRKEREGRFHMRLHPPACPAIRPKELGNPQAPVISQGSPGAFPQDILLNSWFPADFIFSVLSYNYKELQGITFSNPISPCKWESWSLDMLSNFPQSH